MCGLVECYQLLTLNETLMREALSLNKTGRIIELLIHRSIILQEIVVLYEYTQEQQKAA